MNANRCEIRLCMGSSCYSRGNDRILEIIREYIESNHLEEKVDFRGHLCIGKCNHGPNVTIGGVAYHDISESNIRLLLDDAFSRLLTTA